jgi:hypothetical protein
MKHSSLFDADIWVTRAFTPRPRPATPIVDRARTSRRMPMRVEKVIEKPEPFPPVEEPYDLGYSPAVREIVKTVAKISGFLPAEIVGPRRFSDLVRVRQIAAWVARNFTDRSLPAIASELGGRDHTTVLHAVRQVDKSIARGRIEPAEQTVEGWTRVLLANYRVLR